MLLCLNIIYTESQDYSYRSEYYKSRREEYYKITVDLANARIKIE